MRDYLNMTAEKKLSDLKDRVKKAKAWGKRITKLQKRKKSPISEAEFCRRHDIQQATFNRHKNGVSTPSAKTLEKIEKALECEGV